MDVKSLAENDEQEVVREVHEFFADFVSIGQHVFSMNLPNCSEVFKSNLLSKLMYYYVFLTIFFNLIKGP